MTGDYTPCHIERGSVRPCVSLTRAIDDKTVRRLQLADLTSGEHTRSFIVLHAGEHRKQGVVMNHCPFCGGRLLEEEAA